MSLFTNHNCRNWISAITLLVLLNHSFAQSNLQLPQITPPSPVAQTFMRYGEIPVDYSTGVPNIDIPIYTIKGKKLEVPISISYHASGIKVNDIASEVGLGWALNCGGIVSRSINDKPDETCNERIFYTAQKMLDSLQIVAPIYDPGCRCLQGILNFEQFLNVRFVDAEDGMSDRYFYTLPNGPSGVFTYDYSVLASNENSVVMLPYRPFKIQRQTDVINSGVSVAWFKITDDNGIAYIFKRQSLLGRCSEWFLSEMVSADATDTIKYTYIAQTGGPSMNIHTQTYYGPSVTQDQISIAPHSEVKDNFSQLPVFTTPVLESIISSKEIVKFVYGSRDDFSTLKRLVQITISPRNSSTTILRQVQFTPKYFGSTTEDKRLGLDNIAIRAPDDSEVQKYSFTYESQTLPPYPTKMGLPKFNEDFWGYANGGNSNWEVNIDFITNQDDKMSFGGNRDPDDGTFSKACMLTEIKYPTGGKTVFEFERHRITGSAIYPGELVYPYKPNLNGVVAGFKVKSITNYSSDDAISGIKTYEYRSPFYRQITRENFFSYHLWFEDPSFYDRDLVFSEPLLPLEVAPGLPVAYGEVVEYNGTKANHAGRTVYEYSQPYSPSDFMNQPDHPIIFEGPQFYHPYHYDRGNYVPQLTSKTEYLFNGTIYRPVTREVHNYTPLFTSTFNTGIKVSRTRIYARDPYANFLFTGCPYYDFCGGLLLPIIEKYKQSVVAIDTKGYQESVLLTNSKSYVFNPLDSTKFLLTSTDYVYNQQNVAVKEKSVLSSKGDLLKTTYKYPHDLKPAEPYNTMVNKLILTPVIEQQNFNNTQPLDLIRTHYKDWFDNGTIIEPDYVQAQQGNGPLETRINYLSYNTKGNITSIQKTNDVPITYIWGYNGNYPVAEIRGADYATASSYVNLTFLDNAAQYSDGEVRAELDNIRVGLNNLGKPFSLTTYTFKSAVGITSQTDSNGVTVFYEYDSFGRLISLKDHQDNIVKTYEYHYKK